MVESYAGMVSLPYRHPARIQAEREMALLNPILDADNSKLLERNLYLQPLYNQGPYLADDYPIPLPKIQHRDAFQ